MSKEMETAFSCPYLHQILAVFEKKLFRWHIQQQMSIDWHRQDLVRGEARN